MKKHSKRFNNNTKKPTKTFKTIIPVLIISKGLREQLHRWNLENFKNRIRNRKELFLNKDLKNEKQPSKFWDMGEPLIQRKIYKRSETWERMCIIKTTFWNLVWLTITWDNRCKNKIQMLTWWVLFLRPMPKLRKLEWVDPWVLFVSLLRTLGIMYSKTTNKLINHLQERKKSKNFRRLRISTGKLQTFDQVQAFCHQLSKQLNTIEQIPQKLRLEIINKIHWKS